MKKIITSREYQKIIVMAVLIAFFCFLTVYFHLVLGICTVFTHFMYIPVILASFWWKRKGIVVAVFLAGVLIAGHKIYSGNMSIDEDYLRGFSFILMSTVVAFLSERIAREGRKVEDSRAELDQIFQTAADGMRMVDRDFNVLRMNGTFLKLAGIRREDAAGRKCYEVFPSSQCHTPGCPLTRILGGEEHTEDEVEKVRADGKKIPCIVTATPFRGSGGDVIGIVVGIKDITERKQAQDAVRSSEERYRTVFETTGTATVLIEENTIISLANREFERLSGYPKQEIEGKKSWTEFVVKDDLDRMLAQHRMRRERQETALKHYEFRFVTKSGDIHHIFLTIDVIPGTKKSVASLMDITERRRAEEALLKKQQDLETACEKVTATEEELRQNYDELSKREQALRQSEEKFHIMADFTYDWEYWQGPDKSLIYISPSCELHTGYTQQEFLADSQLLVEIVHPDDRTLVVEHNSYAWGHPQTTLSVDFRIIHRDGTVRWIAHACQQITGPDGKHLGRRVSNRDITDRKEAETALWESENNIKAILESLQSALVIIDPKTHIIIDVNSVAIRMIGAPREEIIGHVCHKYICPADVGKCPISDLKQTIDLSERILLNAKGERIPILKSVTPKIISGHEYFIENLIDITELKRVEEELRKSKLMLAEAMDLANLVNWEFDVPTGIFTFDDRFYALYGTTAECEGGNQMPAEVYAREFVHPDDVNVVAEEVNKAINTTDPQFVSQREHRIIRRNGEIRHFVVRYGITKDANGRTIKTHGANQDITERKQAEEKLKRFNEELEQQVGQRTQQINASLQEKVLLLREIHHRVKNNLQIIISLLNLQSRYITDEKTREAIRESQNRIKAMALVHEKLYQTTDLSKIDLSDYTRFLVNQLFAFYGVNSRKVTMNIDIGKIMLDIDTAIPLGLILNELVSNSLKHAFPKEREGEISISVGKQNHALSILFKDNGVGVPQDLDWRNAGSLGLRLVISLVEQLQGTIELDRTAGTVFTIVMKEKE